MYLGVLQISRRQVCNEFIGIDRQRISSYRANFMPGWSKTQREEQITTWQAFVAETKSRSLLILVWRPDFCQEH